MMILLLYSRILLVLALLSIFSDNLVNATAPTYSNISAIYTSGFSSGVLDPATQLSIYVKLVKGSPEAIAYCGAFPYAPDSIILIPFASTSEIMKQGHYAYSSNGVAHVMITGLIPASTYDIYCLTVSEQDNEVQMPYSVAILKSSLSSTQCCKMAYFTTTISSLVAGSSSADNSEALTLYLSAFPANNVTFTFALYNVKTGSTDPASVGTLTPNEITLYRSYTPNTIIPIVFESADTGTFGINVTMSGDSEVEYLLETVGKPRITVFNADSEPNPPVMQSAIFSADGTYVTISFDTPTNQGGYKNTFPCSGLLYFDGMDGATCLWSDNRHILVYPSYSAGAATLAPKSTIALYSDTVQALCTDSVTLCSNWILYAASLTLRVQAPATPTAPTVVVSGPGSVGSCSPILLDFSNSIGSAGRPWASTQVTVGDAVFNANISKVAAFLNSSSYSISPPMPIPRKWLIAGHVYSFTAVFCNFLGACGTASKSVAVTSSATTPVVSIAGLSTRTISAWTPLLITANAYTQSCGVGGAQSAANLKYTWSLYLSGAMDTLLPNASVSQNPAAFKLNPYTLSAGKTYRAQVSVQSLAAGASSAIVTASVFIVVNPSNLVAVIAGGTSRSVQAGAPYTVDASESYDQDLPPGSVKSSGLTYTFSCWQTAPTYDPACPVSVTPSDVSSAVVLVTSDSSTVGKVARISVSVHDSSSSSRTASTYTDLTFTVAPPSVLTVTSSLTSLNSVNVNQQIALIGTLDLVAPCTASWSVDDSSLSLSSISLTPTEATWLTVSPTVNKMTLLLPGGVLPQRASLSFTLQCGSVSSSLALTTNGAPLPGAFRVSPAKGTEIVTPFVYAASMWVDPDLPLSYQFGFMAPTTGDLMVVQGKSETSYGSTKLPTGSTSLKHMVFCTAQVYDVFGAVTSAQVNVTVNPSTNSTQQTNSILQLISASSGSVDSTNAVISTVGSALNSVNCTGAPYCFGLHRAGCQQVANTCGACLPGYFGVEGNQNSLCMSLQQYNNNGERKRFRNRRRLVGVSCSAENNPCNAENWESCVDGRCVQENKLCPRSCAGHGTCSYYSTTTNQEVATCGVADGTCVARCQCYSGYGGAACALTSEELSTRQMLRASLIASLENVTKVDDINEVSLARWSNALSSLTQNADELSASDVDAIHRIANLTISYAKQLGTSDYPSLLGVLAALDSATSVLTTDARRRRLLQGETSIAAASVSPSVSSHGDILSSAGSFGDLITQGMVQSQPSRSYIYSNFRLTTQVSGTTPDQSFGLSGPQTDLEYYSGAQAPFVSVDPTISAEGTTTTSLVVADVSAYADIAASLVSNPLQLRVNGVANVGKVTFTLINNAFMYQYIGGHRPQNFTVWCTTEVRDVTFLCPDSGTMLVQHCEGIAGVKVTYCPIPVPQCTFLDGSTQSLSPASGCRVVDQPYNSGLTTCECLVNDDSNGSGRRLSSTFASVLSESGVTNMVTTSAYIASSFADTFELSTDFTKPAAAQKVLIVILLFASLWSVGLLSLLCLFFRRQKVVAKVTDTKRRINKSGTSANHSTTDVKKYLLAYVDKLIPDVYQSTRSKLERAADETRKHHRYLQLFTARDDQVDPSKRILVLTKMLTVQTMLMFLLAVLYDLQGPDDDGSCPTHHTKSACLHRHSILDSSQRYCKWGIDHHVGYETCKYQSPEFTPKIMMYIILLTSIFTSIFNTPIDKLFDTLEAPTGDSVGESRLVKTAKVAVAGARRASSVAVSTASNALTATASRLSRISIQNGRLTMRAAPEEQALASRRIPEDVNFAHTLAYMALPEISAQAQVTLQRQSVVNNEVRNVAYKRITQIRKQDINRHPQQQLQQRRSETLREAQRVEDEAPAPANNNRVAAADARKLVITSDDYVDQLLEEIMQQRLILPSKAPETAAFDSQWGIEVVSVPVGNGKTISTSLYINGIALRGIAKAVAISDSQSKGLKKKMENFSDSQVGLEILHLFVVDLLGKDTLAAKIFENKFEEDFERTQVVSRFTKWLVMLAVMGLNVFFIYYSLLKGYEKGVLWQNQYLQGCITQLIIEIFLFESMECIWINYWVPDLVSGEVMRAGVLLRESAEKISLVEKNTATGVETEDLSKAKYFLDAPSYLFVSTKLAKMFPNLLESIIVTSYRNHVPGEISKTWKNLGHNVAGAADPREVVRNSFRGNRTLGGILFACVVAVSSGLSIGLQMLGSLPYFYQRIIIRFVQPLLLSGLTILWYFAIKQPVYTAIIVCVLVVVGFVLYVRYQNRLNIAARSGKVTPMSASAAAGSGASRSAHAAGGTSNAVAPESLVSGAAEAKTEDKGEDEDEAKFNEGKLGVAAVATAIGAASKKDAEMKHNEDKE